MKRKFGESVRAPLEECTSCHEMRQVHRRNPRVLCRNCSVRLFPGTRKRAVCANWAKCANGPAVQEIFGRGLCRQCYNRTRLDGELGNWPRIRG